MFRPEVGICIFLFFVWPTFLVAETNRKTNSQGFSFTIDEVIEKKDQITFNQTFLFGGNDSVGMTQTKDADEKVVKSWVVVFKNRISKESLDRLKSQGITPICYIPHNAYLVKANLSQVFRMRLNSRVNRVFEYAYQHRISPEVRELLDSYNDEILAIDIYVNDYRARDSVADTIQSIGGDVINRFAGKNLITAWLNDRQINQALHNINIAWIEPTPRVEFDMDNARIVTAVEDLVSIDAVSQNYTGVGINGHVLEGINPEHNDFKANEFRDAPMSIVNGDYSSHGQRTYGIVFGSGEGNKAARGMLPNAQGYFTNTNAVSGIAPGESEVNGRYGLVKDLIKNQKILFQTASWGYSTTTRYTSRSAEMDNIIFDLDIPITQSQSNTGTRNSRPQAWAKNIISVGALVHSNNTDVSDDHWRGSASIGPSDDGRIKPDLVGFYDRIFTTAKTGYTDFGGTSGATPMIAGLVGLTLEMWTNGAFLNELATEATPDNRFENRPHYTTVKALLINTARQYDFEGPDHDLTRNHQGWGMPHLKTMYDARENMIILNEEVALKANQTASIEHEWENLSSLAVTLVWADPAALPSQAITLINNLDLKVESPSGKIYFGNFGLNNGTESLPGGSADQLNTVENVFINNAESGKWKISVIASRVVQDAISQTEEFDTDFALVVRPEFSN